MYEAYSSYYTVIKNKKSLYATVQYKLCLHIRVYSCIGLDEQKL